MSAARQLLAVVALTASAVAAAAGPDAGVPAARSDGRDPAFLDGDAAQAEAGLVVGDGRSTAGC